jgi:hypothetical protein
MPDNSRQIGSGTQSYVLGDRRFVGINTNLPPNSLDVGYCQDITNMWVDGTALAPRPGWQAENTASLPDPIYGLLGYRTKDNQDNKVVFISGKAIYSHTVSNPVTTTNTHLGYGPWPDPSQVKLVQHGKYVYGVPGRGTDTGANPAYTGGCVFRTDGTNPIEYIPQIESVTTDGETYLQSKANVTGVVVKSIAARTDIDEAYLTSAESAFGKTALSGWPSTWSDNLLKNTTRTPTLSPIIPSGDFDGYDNAANSGNTYFAADWSSDGGASVTNIGTSGLAWAQDRFHKYVSVAPNSSTYTSAVGGTTKAILLDNSGEYIEQTVLNLPYEQWGPATSTSPIGLYNLQWYSFANIVKTEGSVKYSVTVTGIDSSSQDIAGCLYSKEFKQAYSLNESDWLLNNVIIDFREFTGQLNKIKIRFQSTAVIKQQDIVIDNIRFHASVAALSTSVDKPLNNAGLVSIKFKQENTNLNLRNASYVKNRSIRVLFSSTYQDLSTVDTLSFKWDFETGSVTDSGSYPNIVIGLQKNGSTAIAWSSIGVWDKENRYISFNLFRLSTDEKKSIQYIYIKFLEDVFKSDGTSFTTWEPSFGIGDMVRTGNSLTPNNTYEYAFTRWYPRSLTSKIAPDKLLADGKTADGYETNISDISNSITTTSALTAVSLQVNPLVSTGSIGYSIDMSKDRHKVVAVADATDADQHLVTHVPAEYQIRLISADAAPSITYIALDGTTVTPSWSNLSGTNYYYYTVPSTESGKIRYVTSVSNTVWLEHYVSFGKVNYYATVAASNTSISVTTPFVVNDPIVFTTTLGNITGGATYYVKTTTGTAITISASIGGATITPTVSTASGAFATIQRTDAAQYSHIIVYRRCSTIFPDGRFRLIAIIPYDPTTTGTQTITGKNWTATYNNTSSTTPGVITLADTIPDSDLLYIPELYQQGHIQEIGRDNLPIGASAIALFQSRLFISKGNVVYGTWELEQNQEYGIYTTTVPLLTEPGVQKKGVSFTVGGHQDKEIIRAMISSYAENIQQSNSTSTTLYILKDNSVSTIIGFDPTTFTVQLWIGTPGAGISAPQSVVNVDGMIMWLAVSGVIQYNAGQLIPRSTELRKLLSLDPTMRGPAGISKTFYQQSFMVYANRRIFLVSTSSNAGAANQTVWVFDLRTNGWVKWDTINSETFTSGCVLSFSDSIQYVIMGGTTGQLYRLSGSSDISTGGTTAPISWSVLTRQHGQTYSEGVAYHATNRAYQLDLHVQNVDGATALTSPTAVEVNWKVQNQLGAYNSSTNPNGISVGSTYKFIQNINRSAAIRSLGKDIKGTALQIQLSGSTTGTFYIHAVHLHCYDAAIQR